MYLTRPPRRIAFDLAASLLAAVALLAAASTPSHAAARPNVVLIMSDDQGIGDFGVMGNPVIQTPNIDAMARRSARMTTFYVSPVCAPTRACLMTGRYNYRTRVVDTWVGRAMMDTEEVTIAEALSAAGYATGIFGKWHLGDNYPLRPMDQGFQESLVHRGGGLGQPSDPPENMNRYTDAILFRDGKKTKTKGYCTDVYFDAALDFMEKANADKKNFFVYLPTNAPHGPYHDVPENLRKAYLKKDLDSISLHKPSGHQRDVLARIAAMITNIDDNVGRLFKKLDELGITDDTIVIYMVDNGPNTTRYVTADLRGRKSDVHEGGIRSPFWVHWPARLKAGHTNDTPAAHIDVMPTILAACGATMPHGAEEVKLDGRNILPLLEGKDVDWPERPIVIQTHRGNQPVRYHHFMIRQGNWKLVHPTGFGYEGFKKPPTFEKLELYNLSKDPREQNNLASENPDFVKRLIKAYDHWFDDVSSTREDNYAPPRIHIGTPHENPVTLTRQDWRDGRWDRNSNGHWEIHIAEAGSYDFEIVFAPSKEEVGVELEISRDDASADVVSELAPHGANHLVIEDVELDAGDARLKVTLTDGDKERGPFNVHVRRREE